MPVFHMSRTQLRLYYIWPGARLRPLILRSSSLHMPLYLTFAPRLRIPPQRVCLLFRSTTAQGRAWRFTSLTKSCFPRRGLLVYRGASWCRAEAHLVTVWAGHQAHLTGKSGRTAQQNFQWLVRALRAYRIAHDEAAGRRAFCQRSGGWVGKALL